MIDLSILDILILLGILICVVALSLRLSLTKLIQHQQRTDSITAFFLADRDVPWWAIAGSLFASNIGNEHFVGQAGAAFSSGLAIALYEWLAAYLLILLGYVFGPVYIRNKVTTIPEWFEKRFGRSSRILLATITLIGAIVTKISSSLFAGALLCEVVLGISFWVSLPFIILIVFGYTVVGGLKAVIYTDVLQALIFIIGGTVGSIVAINAVGGWTGMLDTFAMKDSTANFSHVIRPVSSEYSWVGMFFGQMIGSIWYWCIDQEMAQRVLSARSIQHGKGGVIFAGFLKIFPPFIIAFPGMAARVMVERCLHSDGIEFSSWCSSDSDQINNNIADKAYLYLIVRLFPRGVVGLVLVSMIVSMMSALSAVFNSASTIFTIDIYQRFIKPDATSHEIVTVGRLSTVAMAMFSFIWLLLIKSQSSGIYLITQSIQTHIAPPLAVVAMMGIFSKRVNGQGAIAGIISGILFGILQYIPSVINNGHCSDQSSFYIWFACIQFNHYAIFVSVFVFMMTATVSYMYPTPELWRLVGVAGIQEASLSGSHYLDQNAKPELFKQNERIKRPEQSTNLFLNIMAVTMLTSVTLVIFVFR